MRDDERRLPAPPATTYHLEPILPPAAVVISPLQVWVRAFLELLDDARDELGERELETFYDIALIRLACDAVEFGLDGWRHAA